MTEAPPPGSPAAPSPPAARPARLAVAGLGLVAVVFSFMQVESALDQAPGAFWALNARALAGVAAGLALLLVGCPLRGAVGPRIDRSAALAGSRISSAPLRVAIGGAVLAAGVALLAYTGHRAWTAPRGLDQAVALVLAAVAIPAGMAWIESRRRRRGWLADLGVDAAQRSLPLWRRDATWLAMALAVWVAGNAVQLDTRPGFFHGDEAMVTQYGRMTYRHPREEMIHNAPVWLALYQPVLSGVPRSLARDLFPDRPYFGARLFSLLVSAGALALAFLLARAAFGRAAAWVALGLMAGSHVMMAFSRMALNNMDALALMAAFGLCLLGAWRSRRASMGMAAGLLAGMGVYTYQGALLALPVVAAFAVLEGLRDTRRLARRWLPLAAMVLGAGLAAAPILVYHRHDTAMLGFRTRAVSLMRAENLAMRFEATGTDSLPRLLAVQAWSGIGGALLWPDTSSNYDYRGLPMLPRDVAALVLAGMVAALAVWRRRRAALLLLLWTILGALAGSLLSVNPPAPYAPRLLVVLPPACILAGWLVAALAGRLNAHMPPMARWIVPLGVVAWLGSAGWRSIDHYHLRYRNDMSNLFYEWVPMGFMEWLRHFDRRDHLVLMAPHGLQLYTSVLELYDTGFPRTLLVEPDAEVPPPAPDSPRTVYAVFIESHGAAAEALARMYPGIAPVEIRNPFRPGWPPTHLVWTVERGTAPPPASIPVEPAPGEDAL